METKDYLSRYYELNDEDNRLCSRHGMVEYLTTMRYIEQYLRPGMRIMEIGAATGRYSHALARKGYQVDAVELVEHNIDVFRQNTLPNQPVTIAQGNAMDLSAFESTTYDITLLLGPLYHLGTDTEKLRALSEAVRITKHGGYIMAAYCMNDAVVIQEGFMRGNLKTNPNDNMLTENFHCLYKPEEVFAVVRLEEIYDLTKDLPVVRSKTIATDGATNYLWNLVDRMDDEAFDNWVMYHFSTCERLDLIRATNHCLDILQKL